MIDCFLLAGATPIIPAPPNVWSPLPSPVPDPIPFPLPEAPVPLAPLVPVVPFVPVVPVAPLCALPVFPESFDPKGELLNGDPELPPGDIPVPPPKDDPMPPPIDEPMPPPIDDPALPSPPGCTGMFPPLGPVPATTEPPAIPAPISGCPKKPSVWVFACPK